MQADLLKDAENAFIYKVLILSDNKLLVDRILSILSSDVVKHKLEIYSSYSVKEFQLVSDQIQIDCLLCDYNLKSEEDKIINGVDFLVKFKQDECVKILLSEDLNFYELKYAINEAGIYRNIAKPYEESELRIAIEHSIEYLELIKENSRLLKNAENQNLFLQNLKLLLEKKEEKKTKAIEESGQMVKDFKIEVELMNKFLTGLQKIEDLKSVEKILLDVLFENLNVDFVKLYIQDFEEGVIPVSSDNRLNISLVCSDYKLGILSVGKTNEPFLDNEKSFLKKIADVVAMTAEKLIRFSVLERMKKQWEATFDSINEPLIIINSEYIVSRANIAFEKLSGVGIKNIIGKRCYSLLNPIVDRPCSGCKVKEVFSTCTPQGAEVFLKNNSKWFTTWTYPIYYNNKVDRIVQFYKDETEKKIYREKIVHTEKLAEIGILAGSVAHEINNPIGGIIAFLQLMDRDSSISEIVKLDLKEMETAAQRCKRIVENLLHFSRKSRDEKKQKIEISNVINSLLPLVQIQIKHDNIDIVYKDDTSNVFLDGVFNELVQSLLNIVYTSIDSIFLKISSLYDKKSFKGLLTINTFEEAGKIFISLKDNGVLVDVEEVNNAFDSDYSFIENVGEFKTLGMFVSYKIIKEYKGNICFSNIDGFNEYLVSFPILNKNL